MLVRRTNPFSVTGTRGEGQPQMIFTCPRGDKLPTFQSVREEPFYAQGVSVGGYPTPWGVVNLIG